MVKMEVVSQQIPTSTPNVIMEYPQEELTTPSSVSAASSSEFSFACTVQPNASLSGNISPLDLSPADDIFFYGHLLPLHLFPQQLGVSPRSSTNSLDSFTLPATEFMQNHHSPLLEVAEPERRVKSKSLGFLRRWRRGSDIGKSEETEQKKTTKTKNLGFEVSCVLKRYARVVRSLLIFREARRSKKSNQFKAKPSYYSGDLSFRGKKEARGRRGEYSSAPASIRTSPVNSRILLTTAKSVPSPIADSTMEELHSAIQAAIAHCKNSSVSNDGLGKV